MKTSKEETIALKENAVFSWWMKLFVIVGAFIINLPTGVTTFYGNLSTYTNSYFRFHIGPSAFDVQPVWMLPTFIAVMVIGFLTADWIKFKIGLFTSYLLAVIAFDINVFLTYFTVQHSIGLTMLTLMVFSGYSVGLIIVYNLAYAVKVMPNRKGLASAITISAFGLGSVVTNTVLTFFINPNNFKPNIRDNGLAYFSQTSVLEKVPLAFVLIGVYSFSLHLPGFFLVHVPVHLMKINPYPELTGKSGNVITCKKTPISNEFERNAFGNNDDRKLLSFTGSQVTDNDGLDLDLDSCGAFHLKDKEAFEMDSSTGSHVTDNNLLELESSTRSHVSDNDAFEPDCLSESHITKSDVPLDTDDEKMPLAFQTQGQNLAPLDVLKTRSYYTLWISLCVLTYGYILVLDYYKHFGQLWIKDDFFLTSAGSFGALSMSLGRLLLGAIIDKIGINRTLKLVLSLNSILMAFWYFTPILSRWLYFCWIQALNCIVGCLFVLCPLAALKLYGEKYYATNYGLLMTASLITSLVSPFLIPLIRDNLEWWGLMALESGASVISLISVITMMPPE